MASSDSRSRAPDMLGITLSGLCLVHCLLLPAVLAVLPLLVFAPLPEWLHDTEWLHTALLGPVVLVSGPVLFLAARRDARIGWFAALGFAALFSALLVHSEIAEQAVTSLGAVSLVMAHWLNLKAHRHD